MIGLGTIINTVAVIIGGLLGLFFKKAINERIQQTLIKTIGVCVLFIGIGGAMQEMLTLSEQGTLVSGGTLMIIACFIVGSLIGELINIERGLEKFGEWLKTKSKSQDDNSFMDGFLTASFTVCIGAMAVIGAINDGLKHDYTLLIAKSVLDFIFVMVMSASLGKGCIFSAIPVFVFQGLITLLSTVIAPIMTVKATSYLSLTGSILIFCVGLNLVWDKKIRVANMLPTIIFAVAYSFLPI